MSGPPVRDILIRSSDDLEELSSEQQDHFKALFAMFFLREDLHIAHMMYAHRELGADSEIDNKWLDRGLPTVGTESRNRKIAQKDGTVEKNVW
jgi:hypothetical protein